MHTAKDTSADLKINWVMETRFFDSEYRPIFNKQGHVYAILLTAADITDRTETRHLVRQKGQRELALNEALVS